MAVTQDIGGGIQVPDASGIVSTILTMKQNQATIAARELEAKKDAAQLLKLQGDISQQPVESAQKQLNLMRDIHGQILSGNEEQANQLFQSAFGTKAILKADNTPKGKSQGLIQIINPENNQIINTIRPNQVDVIKQNLELEKDAITRARNLKEKQEQRGFDQKTLEQTTVAADAQKLLEARLAQTYPEAEAMARARFQLNQQNSGLSLPNLKDENSLNTFVESKADIAATLRPKAPSVDLNQRAVPLKPVDNNDLNRLSAGLSGIKKVNEGVLSLAAELQADSTLPLSVYTTPIKSLLSNTQISQDPRFISLKNYIDTNTWDAVVQYAGTTFTEGMQKAIATLRPSSNDTIVEMLSKSAAANAMFATDAIGGLKTIEASDKDTAQARKMFFRQANVEGSLLDLAPEAELSLAAKTIYQNLPSDILKNRRALDTFTQALPTGLRNSFDAVLEQNNAPRTSKVYNQGLQILGIKP